jgi:hypothetical protein
MNGLHVLNFPVGLTVGLAVGPPVSLTFLILRAFGPLPFRIVHFSSFHTIQPLHRSACAD